MSEVYEIPKNLDYLMITDLIEGLITGALNAQVHHGVRQGPAHVKLQGQIVHSLQLQTS